MRKIYLKDKFCIACNGRFNRALRPDGRLESRDEYENRKYCSHECYGAHHCGINHHNWNPKGRPREDGYIRISMTGKRQFLHRYLMEQKIGRKLRTKEFVHHKDHNKKNNDISNLELMTHREHSQHHFHDRDKNKKGQLI